MDFLEKLFEAQLTIGGSHILWREIIGNAFGFASAILGMQRRTWAWPVGIIGNVLLFTVFFGVWFSNPQEHFLVGQAGRQVFFVIMSVYGWWRWYAARQRRSEAGLDDSKAVTPRWATASERLGLLMVFVVGVVVLQWVFAQLGAGWPAPRWYFWADAWIFMGSLMATYAMARGWVEFWLLWIAVDVVGVPLLVHSGFYPSAVLYAVYGALVGYGFLVWLRACRKERPVLEEAIATSGSTSR